MHHVISTIIEKSPHLDWMKDGLLYLVLSGSKSYNCATPASDDDYKGIAVPSKKYFTGFLHNFEQAELKDPDAVVFNVMKFFNLIASTANPNLLEILHTRSEFQLFVHPAMEEIIDNKHKFLSKRIRYSFGGFAFDQMRRLKLHRAWLRKDPVMPNRKDFGLPDKPEMGTENLKAALAMIDKEMDRYNFKFLDHLDNDQRIGIKNIVNQMLAEMKITKEDGGLFTMCAKKIGMDDNMIFWAGKEREYNSKVEEFKKYNEWKKNRNPERYADEVKFLYDTKFAYHVHRLYSTAIEALETGKLNVFREDRDTLMDIRSGKWSFEQLEEFSNQANIKLDKLYDESDKLPYSLDKKYLDNLCQRTVEKFL